MEGFLEKRRTTSWPHAWQNRWISLKGNTLSWAKDKNGETLGTLRLDNIDWVQGAFNAPRELWFTAYQVNKTRHREFVFRARTSSECAKWREKLQMFDKEKPVPAHLLSLAKPVRKSSPLRKKNSPTSHQGEASEWLPGERGGRRISDPPENKLLTTCIHLLSTETVTLPHDPNSASGPVKPSELSLPNENTSWYKLIHHKEIAKLRGGGWPEGSEGSQQEQSASRCERESPPAGGDAQPSIGPEPTPADRQEEQVHVGASEETHTQPQPHSTQHLSSQVAEDLEDEEEQMEVSSPEMLVPEVMNDSLAPQAGPLEEVTDLRKWVTCASSAEVDEEFGFSPKKGPADLARANLEEMYSGRPGHIIELISSIEQQIAAEKGGQQTDCGGAEHHQHHHSRRSASMPDGHGLEFQIPSVVEVQPSPQTPSIAEDGGSLSIKQLIPVLDLPASHEVINPMIHNGIVTNTDPTSHVESTTDENRKNNDERTGLSDVEPESNHLGSPIEECLSSRAAFKDSDDIINSDGMELSSGFTSTQKPDCVSLQQLSSFPDMQNCEVKVQKMVVNSVEVEQLFCAMKSDAMPVEDTNPIDVDAEEGAPPVMQHIDSNEERIPTSVELEESSPSSPTGKEVVLQEDMPQYLEFSTPSTNLDSINEYSTPVGQDRALMMSTSSSCKSLEHLRFGYQTSDSRIRGDWETDSVDSLADSRPSEEFDNEMRRRAVSVPCTPASEGAAPKTLSRRTKNRPRFARQRLDSDAFRYAGGSNLVLPW